MDMFHKDIDVLLGRLTSNGVDRELKSDLMYMRTIFKLQHFILSGYLGFFGDIVNTIEFVEHLFHSPSCKTSKECMVNYVDSMVSFMIQSVDVDSLSTSMGDGSESAESLLKNLRNIKKANRRFLSTSRLDPSEVLEEKLGVLKDSTLRFDACSAQLEYLLTRIQVLADSAADLCFAFWVKMSDHFLDPDEISRLLHLRNISIERVPLLEVNKSSQTVLLDDQIVDVCKRLQVVKGLLLNLPRQYVKQEKFKDLLRHVAALTSRTRLCGLEEDMSVEVNRELPILLQESKEICLDIRMLLHSHFPLTDAWGMIDSLVMSLNERLNFEVSLVNLLKHEVRKVKRVIEHGNKSDSLDNIRSLIFRTAYEADYVIDSINLNNDPPPYLQSYLSDIIEEANSVHKEIHDIGFFNSRKSGKDVKSSHPFSSQVSNPSSDDNTSLLRKAASKMLAIFPRVGMSGQGKRILSLVNTAIDDNVLGFKKEEEAIKRQLLTGSRGLDVISIVGMGGLGKTTLARKIYDDQIVINYFEVRAWCCVSQEYNMTQLLLQIFSQVSEDELTEKMHKSLMEGTSGAEVAEVDLAKNFSKCLMDKKTRSKVTESDVAEKLHDFLKGRRFLIVLDDIWETWAYGELRRCFPTEENGSRIILTSRFLDLARDIKLHSDPHRLPFFTKEESWELLRWKVVQKESCSVELMEIAKQISESCSGLPLLIVLVAGLLSRIENKRHLWLEVASTLKSITIEHEKHTLILRLIYEHLPDRLKPCLLYFAAFPRDKEITVSKLIHLWAAEGFVEKIEGKNLEDVAEDHLNNLLGGGLITVSKRRHDGSIKSCRVHDIIHKFCSEMANEENFISVISHTNNQASISNLASYRISSNHQGIDFYHSLNSWMDRNPGVRTILSTYGRDPRSSKAIDFSQVSRRLRLIRVMDLESVTVGTTFFSVLGYQPHLRYLAVHTGYVNLELPPSLGNLRNLEVLSIRTENQRVLLPTNFQNMLKLRHLDIAGCFQFGINEDESCLKSIQSLSTVVLPDKHSMGVMTRSPLLRKLKCIYVSSNEPSQECNELLELENLDQLENLHLTYDGPVERRDHIVSRFPWKLKKLNLNGFSLPTREISNLAMIPTLFALKLKNVHFVDHLWDVEESDFRHLNYLKLHNCSVVYWNALNSSFPCLKRLTLRRCMMLKELPSCFRNIDTLEALEVDRCNSFLANSASQIQREANNRSSRLMVRILKSDFKLPISYTVDAKKSSTDVSHLHGRVVDQIKCLPSPPIGDPLDMSSSSSSKEKEKDKSDSSSQHGGKISSDPLSSSKSHASGKSSMKKVVIRLELDSERSRAKALKTVASCSGVDSISLDRGKNQLTVIGDVDLVAIVKKLRKISKAEIVSVGPAKEVKTDYKKKEEQKEIGWQNLYAYSTQFKNSYYPPGYHYRVAEEDPNQCSVQ